MKLVFFFFFKKALYKLITIIRRTRDLIPPTTGKTNLKYYKYNRYDVGKYVNILVSYLYFVFVNYISSAIFFLSNISNFIKKDFIVL